MGTLHPEHDDELRRNLAATAAVRRGNTVPAPHPPLPHKRARVSEGLRK